MSTLILMRHGAAAMSSPDAQRPLTSDGVEQAAATGAFLREHGLVPGLALVSPARRTRETLAASGLDCPARIVDALYGCGPERVLEEVDAVHPEVGVLLVVAHFPAMPETAELLAPGSDAPAFSTGTAVAFSLAEGPAAPGSGTLLAAFTP